MPWTFIEQQKLLSNKPILMFKRYQAWKNRNDWCFLIKLFQLLNYVLNTSKMRKVKINIFIIRTLRLIEWIKLCQRTNIEVYWHMSIVICIFQGEGIMMYIHKTINVVFICQKSLFSCLSISTNAICVEINKT